MSKLGTWGDHDPIPKDFQVSQSQERRNEKDCLNQFLCTTTTIREAIQRFISKDGMKKVIFQSISRLASIDPTVQGVSCQQFWKRKCVPFSQRFIHFRLSSMNTIENRRLLPSLIKTRNKFLANRASWKYPIKISSLFEMKRFNVYNRKKKVHVSPGGRNYETWDRAAHRHRLCFSSST